MSKQIKEICEYCLRPFEGDDEVLELVEECGGALVHECCFEEWCMENLVKDDFYWGEREKGEVEA